MDDQAEPVRTHRPQLPIVLAAAGALLASAVWALVLVLPYVELSGQSFSLFDGDGPVRAATVAPRIVGIVLVVATAAVTLVARDRRGPWWTTSGALLGLLAFSAYWWSGTRPTALASHGPAWYLDGLACALGVVTVVVGALGARDRGGRPRPLSAPHAAVGAGVMGVLALALMAQNRVYLPVFVRSNDVFAVTPPTAVRITAAVTGVLVVATPVLAALARSRAASTGLALGWLALMAPPVTYVVAVRDVAPDGLGAPFVTGCLLAGLTVAGLLTWASVADRPDGPARTAAERRAREDAAPLEL
jgi:hypothetical protein